MSTGSARAEDFLELLRQSRRGRLKLYIGFAAGVGKTYRMLEEAHALRKRGVDVVLGFVETHGRAETAALVDGLEVVPRRRIEYRGVTVEEMDLDAVLARKPEIVRRRRARAHQRAGQQEPQALPGRPRAARRRHQRHRRLQRPAPREPQGRRRAGHRAWRSARPCPTASSSRPIQVVNLDLAVEDLLERLKARQDLRGRQGRVGARALLQGRQPVDAARAVAARGGREPRAPERDRARDARRGARAAAAIALGRVMVCMSSFRRTPATLLRKGSRMAGRLTTDWFVVYVETPREAPDRIDSEAQRHLLGEHRDSRASSAPRSCGCRRAIRCRAARLRALARRRPHRDRPLAPAVLAAAARPLGAAAPGPRGRAASTSTSSRWTRRRTP